MSQRAAHERCEIPTATVTHNPKPRPHVYPTWSHKKFNTRHVASPYAERSLDAGKSISNPMFLSSSISLLTLLASTAHGRVSPVASPASAAHTQTERAGCYVRGVGVIKLVGCELAVGLVEQPLGKRHEVVELTTADGPSRRTNTQPVAPTQRRARQ